MAIAQAHDDFSDWDDTKPVKPQSQLTGKRKRRGLGHVNSDQRRTMTPQKWQKYLEHTANGHMKRDILRALNITSQTVENYFIVNVAARKQLNEAELVWLRRSWTTEEIDSILNQLCHGVTVKTACKNAGLTEQRTTEFYNLVRKDRQIREMYDVAREIQAESWLDDNIDIADDKLADRYTDHKGNERINHEVIQRSKLRIETRQWTMAAINRKRFGDHKHIDHGGEIAVNHALQLSQARKRLEKVRPATIEHATQQVVDNEE